MGHQSLIFISITDPPKPKELEIDDIETLEQVDKLLKEGDIENAKTLVYDYLDISTDGVIKYLYWKYFLYDTIKLLDDRLECDLMTLVNPDCASQNVTAYVWEHTLRWYRYEKRVLDNLSELELLNKESSSDYNYQYFYSEESEWNTDFQEQKPFEIGSLNPFNLINQ